MTGPQYAFVGSRLTDDTLVLRMMLEGLNTQARQWSETITILDNGSLEGLEYEVEQFKHLAHASWQASDPLVPNIVVAFMDRMSHNRDTERLLAAATSEGVPVFVVSNYDAKRIAP